MSTGNLLRPMDLGEQFGATFQLIRRSAGVFVLAVVLVALSYALYQNASFHMMGRLAEIAGSGAMSNTGDAEAQKQAGMQMLGATASNFGFLILYVMILVFSQVAVTISSWESTNDRDISIGEAFSRAIGRPFWSSLLQTIVVIALVVVAAMIVYVPFAIATRSNPQATLIPIAIIAILLIYPLVATIFRIHKVSIESRGPWKGLIASIALVKGSWGRTFLTLLLAALGSGALLMLVTVLTGGGGNFQFGSSARGNDPQAIVEAYNKMKESFSIGSLVATSIATGLAYAFMFYLLTPMYTDLRARRGEFDVHPEEADLGFTE